MFNEIQLIYKHLPNAENRADVWELEYNFKIASGEVNEPEFDYNTRHIARQRTISLLKDLKSEIKKGLK